jgi:hypothetical protein
VSEAPGLGAGVDDVRAVREAVDDGVGESGVGEDLRAFADGRFVVTISDPRSWRSERTWKTSSVASSGSAR